MIPRLGPWYQKAGRSHFPFSPLFSRSVDDVDYPVPRFLMSLAWLRGIAGKETEVPANHADVPARCGFVVCRYYLCLFPLTSEICPGGLAVKPSAHRTHTRFPAGYGLSVTSIPALAVESGKELAEMLENTNIRSSIAVYGQTENLVQCSAASGDLKPGGQPPGMLGVAEKVDGNVNTVAIACRDLEAMGYLHSSGNGCLH